MTYSSVLGRLLGDALLQVIGQLNHGPREAGHGALAHDGNLKEKGTISGGAKKENTVVKMNKNTKEWQGISV